MGRKFRVAARLRLLWGLGGVPSLTFHRRDCSVVLWTLLHSPLLIFPCLTLPQLLWLLWPLWLLLPWTFLRDADAQTGSCAVYVLEALLEHAVEFRVEFRRHAGCSNRPGIPCTWHQTVRSALPSCRVRVRSMLFCLRGAPAPSPSIETPDR